ncbi:Pol polyprotein [Thelohanellus kitauei]|uniref:Pol polyprotein n=1 Tax=Thelohanellus kitauei TaxID=669202 RepID=A0A0C2ITW2_THEKT|nr:Pol polyprotein [Thelohanellus kitauei]
MVRACPACSKNARSPNKEFTSWKKSTRPFERFVVESMGFSTQQTILALKSIFSSERIPEVTVSDNGPQIASSIFSDFCVGMGIEHLFALPHHPESNGLAERFVQTFKRSVSKSMDDVDSIDNTVFNFLISYRFTPGIDGKCPSELFHGRKMRNILAKTFSRPIHTNYNHVKFNPGEPVWVRLYGKYPSWVEGEVVKANGRRVYIVKFPEGETIRHLKSTQVSNDFKQQYKGR